MFKRKLLCKKYINRVIRKKVDKIVNLEISTTLPHKYTYPGSSNSQTNFDKDVEEISTPVKLPESNTSKSVKESSISTTNISLINLINDVPSTPHQLIEFTGESENLNLTSNLRNWACKNNITHGSLNELLRLLKPHFDYLPIDARSFLGTTKAVNIISLDNGKMCYLGIKPNLLKRIERGLRNTSDNILSLKVNIDGIPLFKSSATEFYPILIKCDNLINSKPFAVGIFCGTGKPNPLDVYLRDFINEINSLKIEGIYFKQKLYQIEIKLFTCDAPARSYLKCIASHTSRYGCERCTMVGTWQNHRIHYANLNQTFSYRSNENFLNIKKDNIHIKGKSPLIDASGLDLVSQFSLDPMHLIYLGVVKRLLLCYFIEGKKPHKLSQTTIKEINVRTKSIRACIT